MALLSVWLNLEALYLAQLCIYTGATYRAKIMHLQIIFLKLWIFKKITFWTFWLKYMPKILTPPSFVIVYMMTYCRCLWCLLILYLVANCQLSSSPHGPIFSHNKHFSTDRSGRFWEDIMHFVKFILHAFLHTILYYNRTSNICVTCKITSGFLRIIHLPYKI